MNLPILLLELPRMQENTSNSRTESGFDWLDERFYCGTPDVRCQYCGLPQIFSPVSLEIEACRCGATISECREFTLDVRFSRVQRFSVNIIYGRIPSPASARLSQSTFSGRTPFARNGNPCRRVCEASPRAHGGGHHAAMPRPTISISLGAHSRRGENQTTRSV